MIFLLIKIPLLLNYMNIEYILNERGSTDKYFGPANKTEKFVWYQLQPTREFCKLTSKQTMKTVCYFVWALWN